MPKGRAALVKRCRAPPSRLQSSVRGVIPSSVEIGGGTSGRNRPLNQSPGRLQTIVQIGAPAKAGGSNVFAPRPAIAPMLQWGGQVVLHPV